MPTSNTAGFAEKMPTLEDFALRCARSFGALSSLREDTGPVPEVLIPPTYHAERLAELKKQLADLEAVTDKECEERLLSFNADLVAEKFLQERQALKLRERYEDMRQQVENWQVSSDHHALKKFMLDQLDKSIDWDCRLPQSNKSQAMVRLSEAVEWRDNLLTQIRGDIEYHQKEQDRTVQDYKKRNEWLSSLRESLKDTA